MSQRSADERIQALKDAGVELLSYSKMSTINSCLYSAWRTYILHDRGSDNCYSWAGTVCHDSLELLENDKITETDLLPRFEAGIAEMDELGLEFPKSYRGTDEIRQRYIADIRHFCKTYYRPKGKFTTEKLLIYQVNDQLAIRGYADLLRWGDENDVTVLDYKTSSNYAEKDLIEHGRQLTIYGMALEQAGYKVRSTAWIMLKYVEIRYIWYPTIRSRTKKECTRIVNRSKIYDTIALAVESACRDAGMDEAEIEFAMLNFKETNILGDRFPLFVRNQFSIKPYVRNYPYTDELKQEALDYINKTADLYKSLPHDKEHPWEPCKITKENSFFCNNLCSHRKSCQYIRDYNAQALIADPPKTEADLF